MLCNSFSTGTAEEKYKNCRRKGLFFIFRGFFFRKRDGAGKNHLIIFYTGKDPFPLKNTAYKIIIGMFIAEKKARTDEFLQRFISVKKSFSAFRRVFPHFAGSSAALPGLHLPRAGGWLFRSL